jgi:hypothetical protein
MSNAAMFAASAAAAARRQMEEQEEEMTTYSREDLEGGWEFKIVRANMGAFGKPAELKKLIEQEARAGWVMVEKFDNYRIRFRRPTSARQSDPQLPADIDPYRTYYGMSPTVYVILAVVIAMVVMCGIAAIVLVVLGVWGSGGSHFPIL